ncbi:hypothetical protein N7499_009998 [Penicillium canescens]|uniref:Uncharacterized protein n=1 Tax=Penicillium canescens TaxID=5083 RepID=A0AAD6NE33_PENCN|nr:uncharacterized protein N7446_007985 [Penicillium canescens]KAJ6018821.1 hypothetical protein N7522_000888 [Penicillium canescens]KAJ6033721.1 hypothetical protein N7444_011492 [Penicillium canescens]KAJ6057086.1 hypothetical protein N7460_000360 [Penicillium canescens]KAJ6058402.1 hypothetical protein N7446_007985 [Penicillium canescens]KAJ6071984.1 hypothetical protein N7499_009998 [Penicillium canescens]
MAWSTLLFRGLEVWLTARLLRSPIFHRMVGRVHEKIQHVRHGVPPEQMGGTKLENNGSGLKQFFDYFKEELKDQAKGNPRNKL